MIVIHPGMARTATSTLQEHGFAKHPEIHFLGTPGLDAETVWAIRQIAEADSIHFDEQRVTRQLHAAAERPANALVTVISHENYSLYEAKDKGQVARRLRSIFPDARILFTLRRQQDLVASLYLNGLRRDIKRKQMLPFDEWFEVALREPHLSVLDDLRYDRLIDYYSTLFGRERVSVLLFEELKRDPNAYYRSIAAVLGIEPERFVSSLSGKRENVSISQAYLSFWKTFGPFVPRLVTRKLALHMPRFRGRPSRVRLKAAHREALEAMTREGNRQLAADFGLDLAGHGYFV